MFYKDDIVQMDMKRIQTEHFLDKIPDGSKILVTGCNGMIATYLIYYLFYLNDNHHKRLEILAMTRSKAKTETKYADVLNRGDFTILVQDVTIPFDGINPVDFIFHLASSADPVNILKHPVDIIKANTVGLINVLEYARKTDVKRVVFASTREVYGKMDDQCTEVYEDSLGIIDQMGTRACYPESKKMAECLLNSYQLQYHVNYSILRIAHTYGPGMPIINDGRIMSDLISCVVQDRDIILNSDGSAIRGFMYITDLISGMMHAACIGEANQVYNLCNEDENISILELAQRLIALFPEKHLKITYKKLTASERAAYCSFKRVRMNTDKIRRTGWKPVVPLADGLVNTVKSYES